VRRPTGSDTISDPELDELICDCIDMFLSTLPLEQAEIVQRVDVDRERPADVAHSLGLSAGTLAYQIECGRQALKERFAEMSRICPEHGLAGCDCNLAKWPNP